MGSNVKCRCGHRLFNIVDEGSEINVRCHKCRAVYLGLKKKSKIEDMIAPAEHPDIAPAIDTSLPNIPPAPAGRDVPKVE